MGRFACVMLIAGIATPLPATTPPEPAQPAMAMPSDFNLAPAARVQPRHLRSERPAFPTEQPRVPVNDALRPPELLWYPSPASLVKVVPAKVRYKLRF